MAGIRAVPWIAGWPQRSIHSPNQCGDPRGQTPTIKVMAFSSYVKNLIFVTYFFNAGDVLVGTSKMPGSKPPLSEGVLPKL